MTGPSSALLTDFYQLSMAQAYFELGMQQAATFELFVRRLPTSRGFLVFAGAEQAIELAERFRFAPAELDYLSGLGRFSRRFLRYLEELRFSGSIAAMAEGTIFFGEEPVVRVSAPIIEAQLLETRLMNICHFQTLIASKAARCVIAAGGRELVDFGLRRAHEADAGVFAARAAFIAGFGATANVEAGRRFGIPLSGTMAHSFIQAHDQEEDAFRNFLSVSEAPTAVLVDTYDTARGVERAMCAARRLESGGRARRLAAVRIDSGDLAAQARLTRSQLDRGGFGDVKIILSGGLDECQIEDLMRAGVPVDAFGVGTALDTSADAPSLDMAYKLQSYAGKPRRKRSAGKATWPGIKQVYRQQDELGPRDYVALEGECESGTALVVPRIDHGRRLAPLPALSEIRDHCRRELAALPASMRALHVTDPARVEISAGIRALAQRLDAAEP